MKVYSPITGEVIKDVHDWSREEVGEAIGNASIAAVAWGESSPIHRSEILQRISRKILEHEDQFVELETKNLGAPESYVRDMVRRAASSFAYFGTLCDKVHGQIIPVEGEFFTYSIREPYGVVAAVVPWNAPLIFAAKKLAPALAFGNACILKPAPETPLSAMLLEKVMLEAGLPEGVGQVVTGGRETGECLTNDARIDLIVFTGHDATGSKIASAAATHLIPTALELGGKSAQVIFEDAPMNRVVDAVIRGIFSNAGQACIAGSRILVQDTVADEVYARLVERTERLRVGNPFDEGTDVGPQATATQQTKSLSMLSEALDAGAEILASAKLPDAEELKHGYFVPPTLLKNVDPDSSIVQDEIFGPIAIVQTFSSEEEAIALANSTEYGLAAGLWTENISRAFRVSKKLRAGSVWINTYKVVSDRVPFGGVGRSGYGREGGQSAVELYTRVKSVWTSLHGDTPSAEIAF